MSAITKPYKAIITDLDGTLLNAEHKIGDLTKSTLETLAKQGVDIYIATGRNYPDVVKMVQKLDIDHATLVTSNGARADYLSGEKLLHHFIAEDIVKQLLAVAYDDNEVFLNTYQGDDWYINEEIPGWQQYFNESGYGYQLTDFSNHDVAETEKVFYIAKNRETPEVLAPIEQHMRTNFAEVVQLTHSMPNCFEIMAKGINKGATLAELVAKRGYSLADCIAFGDGMNDIEMLSAVGKGCVMQNASEQVKSVLPNLEVIGHHKDEAVAGYLQKVFDL